MTMLWFVSWKKANLNIGSCPTSQSTVFRLVDYSCFVKLSSKTCVFQKRARFAYDHFGTIHYLFWTSVESTWERVKLGNGIHWQFNDMMTRGRLPMNDKFSQCCNFSNGLQVSNWGLHSKWINTLGTSHIWIMYNGCNTARAPLGK